jgi:hypothetical protein
MGGRRTVLGVSPSCSPRALIFRLRALCDPRHAGCVRPFRRGSGHDFFERAGGKKRADGADARRPRARRRECFRQTTEQVGFWTSGGEGSLHLSRALISCMITPFPMRDLAKRGSPCARYHCLHFRSSGRLTRVSLGFLSALPSIARRRKPRQGAVAHCSRRLRGSARLLLIGFEPKNRLVLRIQPEKIVSQKRRVFERRGAIGNRPQPSRRGQRHGRDRVELYL